MQGKHAYGGIDTRYRLPSMSVFLGLCVLCCHGVYAQSVPPSTATPLTLPNSADIGRIIVEQPETRKDFSAPVIIPQAETPYIAPPEGADKATFVLKQVKIEGATVFSPSVLRDIYSASLGHPISLESAYHFAGAITERYRNAGYFLSIAYVPEQRIKDGVVTIRVVEGYVEKVQLKDTQYDSAILQHHIRKLVRARPLTSEHLESFLLRANDLYGVEFSGVLAPMDEDSGGGIALTLVANAEKGAGSLTFDNSNSRFLSPHRLAASYSTSLLPLQQTSISAVTSLPLNTLNYITLNHAAAIAADVTINATGNITHAEPTDTLKPFELESDGRYLSVGMNYQWIRQRQENLSLNLNFDMRESLVDALNRPLTRDHIRALRAGFSYDVADAWNGVNVVTTTFSHGLSVLGANDEGEPTLSRAEATPDFSKAEFSYTRLQSLTGTWSVVLSSSGQISPDALYSSEEFGYGGQAFGRAYDASDIGGDSGIAGSVELRYSGWLDVEPIAIAPYGFYDAGAVWNHDKGQENYESASSVGFGIRGETSLGISGNVGVAWPISRKVENPIYGGSGSSPRLLFELSHRF
jgi:hemolysin activation/secretion protein